ncbi:hypothetical protein D9757_002804 [Collybiopsis confluens]|uniref:SAP domain-containing protein n=1 Tax=Collybiopsis confluens TaxID=2823264 RepID=A0A8H5MDQ1_9AGAR|nr:hypothetical protein D9757_002804 [Collybiopsis confluens]
MAPSADRKALEALSRIELQKRCKDHGLKANLKSEALIELLLDAQKVPTTSQPGRRSVSTRMSSRSTTAGRTSSMIIHDVDEDEDESTQSSAEAAKEESDLGESKPPPIPRTRKAKETQLRLGVGRPLAAGGTGARAVTKSVSVSRSKKGKGTSRSVKKPSEDTIMEEPESEKNEPETEQPADNLLELDADQDINPSTSTSLPLPADFDACIVEALKPLHQQLKTLKAELEQVQALRNEVSQTRSKVADIEDWKQRVETLTTEVKDLREKAALVDSLNMELQQLKESIQRTSTPMSETGALSISRAPALVTGSQPLTATSSRPGIAPVLLGKRHRDSTASNVTGVIEEDEESTLSEADLATTVLRPNKKRAKLGDNVDHSGEGHGSLQSSEEDDDVPGPGPSFTVFNGPEPEDSYIDPPPPITPLPSLYNPRTPPNNGPSRRHATSTQGAAENATPFSFNFLPVPPTPGYSLGAYPYPQHPQSPTPIREQSSGTPVAHNRDRTDMFQAFGLPPPTRPRSRLEPALRSQEVEMGAYINPSAFDNDNEGATRSDDSSGTIKRTMYGTELEANTRFGDFGLEGVATGFNWNGDLLSPEQ